MKSTLIYSKLLLRTGFALVAAFVLLGQSAMATMYYTNAFNYTPNAGRLGTNAGWSSYTSANYVVLDNTALSPYSSGGFTLQDFPTPSLHVKSAPNGSVALNGAYTTNTASGINFTGINTGSGGYIYCSFIYYPTVNLPQPYAYAFATLMATNSTSLVNVATNAANQAFSVCNFTNNGSGKLAVQVAGCPAMGVGLAGVETNSVDCALNVVHLVVIKYDLTTGQGFLFLDPPVGGVEPATPSAFSKVPASAPSFTGVNTQGRFAVWGNYTGYSATFHLDTLRVASSWAEVTPAGASTSRQLTWQGSNTVWDAATTANWITNGGTTRTLFTNYDYVTFDDSATNFTVKVSGAVTPGSIAVNATNDYAITNAAGGYINGLAASLFKTNIGTLTINSSNILGNIFVAGGVLRPANNDALGGTSSITITNGGTLDINGSAWLSSNYPNAYLLRPVNLSGNGYNSQGAVMNSSANSPTALSGYANSSFSVNVALTGDTTLNAANGPLDIGYQYGGTLAGNGKKLTKTGAYNVVLNSCGSTGLGDIEIQQGYLVFNGGGTYNLTVDMGNAANTLTVDTNATLGLYAPQGTNGGNLNKVWVLNPGATVFNGYANNTNLGPVTLNGLGIVTINVDSSYLPSSLALNGAIDGASELLKSGTNTLVLNGTNTYTGNTVIALGKLALGANASISNTPMVSIGANAVFDVSALASGFTFSGASPVQTLDCWSTSGVATNVAGTGAQAVTLASGALASFQANSNTVGNILVQGDLNLNNNAITIYANQELVVGTYRLLTCTGTLTGTANTTVTINGIALPSGVTATISTTTGSGGHVVFVVSAGSLPTPAFSGLVNKSVTYGSSSLVLSGTVSASGPVYPASGETITVTINGNAQNTTINDSTGDFSFTYNPSTIPAGVYTILYSYPGSGLLNATNNNSTTLTVNKRTPVVTSAPTAGAITYGQTLADSALTGGTATTAGSFAFTTPATAPNAGTASQGVTFTPMDTANYNNASTSASVTVNKATPLVEASPTASSITYGQTLADSNLSGGSATNAAGGAVGGSFTFTTPATAPNAGTASQGATFTPTDTANYNNASTSASVTVNKATPIVEASPTASTITYGQTLADSTLSGGSATNAAGGAVAGSFAFTTPATAPNVGTASQGVIFTPTDTANYNNASTSASVTVDKATPLVEASPTASSITYGQTLADSTLSGGSATNAAGGAVAGSFAFTTPATAPNVGTASQGVTFTPTDTANYNTASTSVSVTVNALIPPTISVAAISADSIALSWSDSATNGFTLQTTTNLDQAGVWADVLTITNTAGVTMLASNQASFFRLYKP